MTRWLEFSFWAFVFALNAMWLLSCLMSQTEPLLAIATTFVSGACAWAMWPPAVKKAEGR